MPKVVISIVNWKKYPSTLACLKSLETLDYPHYEIWVVDNGSQNESVERIRAAFPRVKIIHAAENLGFAGGHRLVLAHVMRRDDDGLLWLLNNDAEVRPDTLSALVDACLRWGDGIYGSVTLAPGDAQQVSFGGGWELAATGAPDYGRYNVFAGLSYTEYLAHVAERRVADVNGSSLLVPLRVVQRYGFMDTSFFMYGEETEYCLRLNRQGLPVVVVPRSAIIHLGKGSFETRPDLAWLPRYYQQRNLFVIFRRYRGWRFFAPNLWGQIVYLFKVWAKSVIRTRRLGLPPQERFRALAIRDVLLNRMGKTYSPETFINE